MKFKQFLLVCLVACAVMQSNVMNGCTNGATTATPVAARQQGEVDTNLKLFISPDKKRYWPGEPIVINITLKNDGKADVPLEFTRLMLDYQTEVVLPNGKKAIITSEGKKMIENLQFYGSTISGVIPVGKEFGDQFKDLTKIYDMKQDGVYQITLSRLVPKRIDPKKGAKSLYTFREITPEEWSKLFSAPPKGAGNKPTNSTQAPAAPPKANATSATDSNEWVKITSNTIRIGIGDIPDGALDEKPFEKAAPAKTDKPKVSTKTSPPAKPKAKK
ncbi:MAG: hypothetical protein ABI210_08825 [Abditibacteriaceae bacterium]